MSRNAERDAKETAQKKEQLIKAGFELFSEYGIELVSLSAVADKANVGVATLYKYFQNKVNLTVAISGSVWSGVWNEALQDIGMESMACMDPCQLFELYADAIIRLYRQRPEVLKYSGNYKTFIRRECVDQDDLSEHLDPLRPVVEVFYRGCDDAQARGLLRSDVSKEEMHSFVVITMLAMAERYAQGIVWTEGPEADHLQDLIRLKEMLLAWLRG